MTIHKWGGLASFLIAAAFLVPPWIYLTGNLGDLGGILAYDLADFLSGPVLSASLVFVSYLLRERLGEGAPRRLDLALLAALLAAAGMAAVAFVRASNRHYHLIHPELHLEDSVTVLTVWATLTAGLTGLGFHFLGWAFVLIGSAGWTALPFPRLLAGLYLLAGGLAWFVYRFPDLEGLVMFLAAVISFWQGILMWRSDVSESTAGG